MFTGQMSSHARQVVQDHRTSPVMGEPARTSGWTDSKERFRMAARLLQEIDLGIVDHLLGRKRLAGLGGRALLLAAAAFGAGVKVENALPAQVRHLAEAVGLSPFGLEVGLRAWASAVQAASEKRWAPPPACAGAWSRGCRSETRGWSGCESSRPLRR